MAAYASPIVYHVDYQNNGVLLVGTITTDGKLGKLASEDIVDLHLIASTTGLPGTVIYPLGYSIVTIHSMSVTATTEGLFFDTTDRGGSLIITENLHDTTEVVLRGNSMAIYGVSEPISGNYEFASAATPPPVPVPPIRFHASASTISGTVTKTIEGRSPVIRTIGASDTATAATDLNTVTDQVPNPGNSQTVFDVPIYNLRNIENSATTDYTIALDDGIAETKTGPGSFLNGLVYWQSNDDRLSCKGDAAISNRVDCTSTEILSGLLINRVGIHAGKYPAGTSFPVSGKINDPNCAILGVETFSGYLILQESRITGLGTGGVTAGLAGLHLVGTASCVSVLPGRSFTTQYDMTAENVSLPNYDTGSGNSATPYTAFSLQIQ